MKDSVVFDVFAKQLRPRLALAFQEPIDNDNLRLRIYSLVNLCCEIRRLYFSYSPRYS